MRAWKGLLSMRKKFKNGKTTDVPVEQPKPVGSITAQAEKSKYDDERKHAMVKPPKAGTSSTLPVIPSQAASSSSAEVFRSNDQTNPSNTDCSKYEIRQIVSTITDDSSLIQCAPSASGRPW
jgi:hypothetical protein